MQRNSQQLISQLTASGLRFRGFVLALEGAHSVGDGIWNYKDVPHLPVVHAPLLSHSTHVSDGTFAAINLQKVLGLTFPVCTYAYDSGLRSLTYYSTLLFFVLIVETVFRDMGQGRTRVETTYNIGSPPALAWCYPLIRWLLTRNNRFLMSGDIAMRARRGQLRAWGYSFRQDVEGESFEGSLDIMRPNVIAPPGERGRETVRIPIADLRERGERLVGRDDHLGLRLLLADGKVLVLPRLCPHEGACLDGLARVSDRLRCPWHGRLLPALGTLDLSGALPQSVRTPNHEVTLSDGFLTVTPLGSGRCSGSVPHGTLQDSQDCAGQSP